MAADTPKHIDKEKLKKIAVVTGVSGVIVFLAGFGLPFLDEKTVTTAKDVLNAGVEAIIAILVSGTGILVKLK
jgi:hypothetical protein